MPYKEVFLGGPLHGKIRREHSPHTHELRVMDLCMCIGRANSLDISPTDQIGAHQVTYTRREVSLFGRLVVFWVDRDQDPMDAIADFLLFPLET